MKSHEFITESIDMKNYIGLLTDFGFFISLNTTKIQQYSIDQSAKQELANMQMQFRQPIINGQTFFDVANNPTFYKNPKVIPILLKYIYDMLKYIEPRIQKYTNDTGKNLLLPRLQKIKDQYKQVVGSIT